MQVVFDSRPVSLTEGLVVISVGVVLLLIVEVEKRIAAWLGSEPMNRQDNHVVTGECPHAH